MRTAVGGFASHKVVYDNAAHGDIPCTLLIVGL